MTRVPGRSYVVGGAVRDRLLGLPVSDRDHVVVGATIEEMEAAGFKAVGRDFPVFLHPQTHEEYALARTERKVAPGYAGFTFHADPSVTLEADLERRDLTINAMAEESDGRIIDPFGGQDDLRGRVFRHVGPAFVEDPVRILRIARFAARFADFEVASDTTALMRSMVAAGEVDALVPERVWQELARGLMERHPTRMLVVLRDVDALERLLPELAVLSPLRWDEVARALDRAAPAAASLDVRVAVLLGGLDSIETVCARFAVPRALRELALLVRRERDALMAFPEAPSSHGVAEAFVTILERSDAFRRRARFMAAIDSIGLTIDDGPRKTRFTRQIASALEAAVAIDAGKIAKAAGPVPATIAQALREARTAAIDGWWSSNHHL